MISCLPASLPRGLSQRNSVSKFVSFSIINKKRKERKNGEKEEKENE